MAPTASTIPAVAHHRQASVTQASVARPAANTRSTASTANASAVTSFVIAYPTVLSGVIASCLPHPCLASIAASDASELIATAVPYAAIDTITENRTLPWPTAIEP